LPAVPLTLLARGKLSLSHASGERDKNGFSPLLPACVGGGLGVEGCNGSILTPEQGLGIEAFELS